jgi:hypothetical protein
VAIKYPDAPSTKNWPYISMREATKKEFQADDVAGVAFGISLKLGLVRLTVCVPSLRTGSILFEV